MRKERQGNAMKDEVQLEKEKNTMVREPEDIDLEEVLYAGDLSREYEPDKLQEEDDKDEEEQRQTGEHVHRQRPHRKRREHRLWVRILKKTSIFVGVVTVLTVIVVFGFKLQNVTVDGNEYYSDEEILSFIHYDDSMKNTLLLFWKNREPVIEGIPFINKISVSIQSPGTLKVEVTEKIIIGAVEDNGTYMFFDNEGNVAESSTAARENIPVITGLAMNGAIKLNEKLPVEDAGQFDDLLKLALSMQQYDVEADAISCASDGTFSFSKDSLTVKLGLCRNLEDKLTTYNELKSQEVLLEGGTLLLEDYDSTKQNIIFSKDSK